MLRKYALSVCIHMLIHTPLIYRTFTSFFAYHIVHASCSILNTHINVSYHIVRTFFFEEESLFITNQN